ncbi:TetR/AcrR family transcriptional regulator [Comamonas sp. 4034]|uniref:TetR/AcrR family transcriptional regulator n=1 Tax=Comamonas sp. 4034 TaxID=3156455 RepID=UPI003D1B7992
MPGSKKSRPESRVTAEPASQGVISEPVFRAQGLRTRNNLLEQARKQLLSEGTVGFSLRSVAKAAGISISNAQYYFPGRTELLREVMKPVLEGYTSQMDPVAISSLSPEAAQDVLRALFQQALADAQSVEQATLIMHFWSIGAGDPEAQEVLGEAYDVMISGTASIIGRAYPTIEERSAVELAALLVAMCDGLLVQVALVQRAPASVEGIVNCFLSSAQLLLEQTAQKDK